MRDTIARLVEEYGVAVQRAATGPITDEPRNKRAALMAAIDQALAFNVEYLKANNELAGLLADALASAETLLELARTLERELAALREGAPRDAERYRWLRQYLHVASEEPGSWTCWLLLDVIPYRSQTDSVEELLDTLMKRFPLDAASGQPAIPEGKP
jgi:hypothetical protein